MKSISKVIKNKVKKGVYTTANKKLHQTINNNTIISQTNNPKIHPKNTIIATKNNLTGGSSKNIDDDDLCQYIDNVDKRIIQATKNILNISEVVKKTEVHELKSTNASSSSETLSLEFLRVLNNVPGCTYNGPNKMKSGDIDNMSVSVNIDEAVLSKSTKTTSLMSDLNAKVYILKQKDKMNIELPLLHHITEQILNHEDACANVLNSKDLEQNVILHCNSIVNKDTTKRIAQVWNHHHCQKKRKTKGNKTNNASNKKIKCIANVKPYKLPPKLDVTSVCNVEKKSASKTSDELISLKNVETNVSRYPSPTI